MPKAKARGVQPDEQRPAFDAEAFLKSAGAARRVATYQNERTVFSQGQPSDAVMYIQKGAIKISVVSRTGAGTTAPVGRNGRHFTCCAHPIGCTERARTDCDWMVRVGPDRESASRRIPHHCSHARRSNTTCWAIRLGLAVRRASVQASEHRGSAVRSGAFVHQAGSERAGAGNANPSRSSICRNVRTTVSAYLSRRYLYKN
jgi:hypothetical protein